MTSHMPVLRPILVRTIARAVRPRGRVPRWLRAILGIPLEKKILGANLVILTIALPGLLLPFSRRGADWHDTLIVFGALGLGAGVSYALVRLALKPVNTLEQIARGVSLGRMGERVPASLVADPNLAHLASTMNQMLDTLVAHKKRLCELAAEVVYSQEKERAQVARDLDDSVAQTLAAAAFQVTATSNIVASPEAKSQLAIAQDLLRRAIEDVRSVSKSLHPRIAIDLGLPTALKALADITRQRSLIDVRVHTSLNGPPIPAAISTTFYRVAQEALRNVELHADAAKAVVSLTGRPGLIELEVTDDGCGLDNSLQRMQENPVLARMRQRLSLAGGDLHIHSTRDCGTRLIARAKLETEAA